MKKVWTLGLLTVVGAFIFVACGVGTGSTPTNTPAAGPTEATVPVGEGAPTPASTPAPESAETPALETAAERTRREREELGIFTFSPFGWESDFSRHSVPFSEIF